MPNQSTLRDFTIFLSIIVLFQLFFGSALYVLQGYNLISPQNLSLYSDVVSSLSFSISVLLYLRFYKQMSWSEIIQQLKLSLSRLTVKNFTIGILLVLIAIVLTFIITVLQGVIGVTIYTNTQEFGLGTPLWYILFISFIAPINEEVLFRGFLVPRIGIFFSALIFGLLHYTYNSTFGIEMIFAFIFGLFAGYIYKRTESLYPSMIAHILFNAISLFVL